MKKISEINDHVIVCGAGSVGKRIAKELHTLKIPFVLVDNDENRLHDALLYLHPTYFSQLVDSLMDFGHDFESEYEHLSAPELSAIVGAPYLQSLPTDDTTLAMAGIDRARALVTALPEDGDNLMVVVGARGLATRAGNTNLRIMSRVEDERFVRKFYLAGADNVRVPSVVAGYQIASHTVNPELGSWSYQMMADSNNKRIQDTLAIYKPDWIGKSIDKIRAEFNVLILSIKRQEQYMSPPPIDAVIDKDDILIFFGEFK